ACHISFPQRGESLLAVFILFYFYHVPVQGFEEGRERRVFLRDHHAGRHRLHLLSHAIPCRVAEGHVEEDRQDQRKGKGPEHKGLLPHKGEKSVFQIGSHFIPPPLPFCP